MANRGGWGSLPLVAKQAFNDSSHGQASCELFVNGYRQDPTVTIRRMKRTVRGGGAAIVVDVVVVRKKVKPI